MSAADTTILAGSIVGALVVVVRPIRRPLVWVWRQLVAAPLARWLQSTVVRPMVDEVRAASKAQHDEQNAKLDIQGGKLDDLGRRMTAVEDFITGIEAKLDHHVIPRLDRGASVMAEHDDRLAVLEARHNSSGGQP